MEQMIYLFTIISETHKLSNHFFYHINDNGIQQIILHKEYDDGIRKETQQIDLDKIDNFVFVLYQGNINFLIPPSSSLRLVEPRDSIKSLSDTIKKYIYKNILDSI